MEIDDEDSFDLTGKVVIRGRAPEFIGSYSVVYRGKWGTNTVAVKIIRSVGALSTMRRKVRRERIIWEALEHPNILPFYGHAGDEEFEPFGAFISPWCSNGDVRRFLERYGREMEAAERVELWKGVLSGVAFLHTRNPVIVHGDLKPGNILIDDDKNPRICDFGLARIIQEGGTGGMTTTTEHTGTERYLAPELVTSNLPTPSTESDVYALGCLGLECIYLESPYKHRQNNHHGCIIIDIKEGIPPAIRQDDIHSPLDFWWGDVCSWEVLEGFWHPDPSGRPVAAFAARDLTALSVTFDGRHVRRIPTQNYDALVDQRDPPTYSQASDAGTLVPSGGVGAWQFYNPMGDGNGPKSYQEREASIVDGFSIPMRQYFSGSLQNSVTLDRPESSKQYSSTSFFGRPGVVPIRSDGNGGHSSLRQYTTSSVGAMPYMPVSRMSPKVHQMHASPSAAIDTGAHEFLRSRTDGRSDTPSREGASPLDYIIDSVLPPNPIIRDPRFSTNKYYTDGPYRTELNHYPRPPVDSGCLHDEELPPPELGTHSSSEMKPSGLPISASVPRTGLPMRRDADSLF